jgi:outer membrane protein assembly factor BamE (lipoprotein component of BamABCDE complex)
MKVALRLVIGSVLLLPWLSGCASGLHPHETLAGQYFPSHRVAEVREGSTPEEVSAILGEPFEQRPAGEETVWRYFEQSHPRGCTTYVLGLPLSGRPTWVREAIITFRENRVSSVKLFDQALPSGSEARRRTRG